VPVKKQMGRRYIIITLFLIILVAGEKTCFSRPADTTSFRLTTRYSFYTYEKKGELLLFIPQGLIHNRLSVRIMINKDTTGSMTIIPFRNPLRIPFDLTLPPSYYPIKANITAGGKNTDYTAKTTLRILTYKSNEVKIDHFTGGLIVNKRDFFPFGFYTYTPVHPTLPEEEAVKGFNMISPYQKILPSSFSGRKEYMDRCAQLGMKVHYNLLSVSGGGGVSSKIEGMSDKKKRELLVSEIQAFKDHPALLAWYIADEPNGYKLEPDSLLTIYRLIKKLDPWHPVSVVFMAPFMSSRRYADVLDIVMADPYPVPTSPVSMVGDVARQLRSEFSGRKPVWMVPQAFGGGEWWSREPTLQELRAMTYQSVIYGATGIQYFVRQGLNLFPKSAATWAECGRMAVEMAELTPWLLSFEETIAARSDSRDVIVRTAIHDGQLMIMAANTKNAPIRAGLSFSRAFTGKGKVLFENRTININSGNFTDYLPALGTQVYMITIDSRKDSLPPWKKNLITDPGFEDISSPGIPASCYARGGGDRGALFFLDSREHVNGNHSLRLVTPSENKSVKLRFFPFKGRNGAAYYVSVWAKSDSASGKFFEIALGDYEYRRFEMTDSWKEFVTIVTIPYFTDQPLRTNIILQMPSSGTAWFDMIQAKECVDIHKCVNPELFFPKF